MTRVLLAAADAAWGSIPVEAIASTPGMTLVRSCPDLPDLLAAALAGLADVAVVDGALQGIDVESVATLRRSGVRTIAVAASPDARDWLLRLGVDRAVAPAPEAPTWQQLLQEVVAVATPTANPDRGETVAVWGPLGGPGRTTMAIALALASASAGRSTLLLDLDPYGASVAQHLGLAEEGSGLLAAVRSAHGGTLDHARLDALCVDSRPGLRVLTGITRPDQWVELRRGALDALLDVARSPGERTVLDIGADLDDGNGQLGGTALARNNATLAGLEAADRVVAVGSADAVGVGRLLRGLRVLADRLPTTPVDVVVNKFRHTLGWTPRELTGLVARSSPGSGIYLLTADVPAADAAMLAAKSPWEEGGSLLGADLRTACSGILGLDQPSIAGVSAQNAMP